MSLLVILRIRLIVVELLNVSVNNMLPPIVDHSSLLTKRRPLTGGLQLLFYIRGVIQE